jgi:hypothetical protein
MIDQQQLERWAQAPSQTEMAKIKNTRQIIEEKIKQNLPIPEIKQKYSLSTFNFPDIYLQGSYANSTNIRFDSDVDIVVQLNDVFWSDKTWLTEFEKQQYVTYFSSSAYKFVEFKNNIYSALIKAFGEENVEYSDKCLKVKENTYRVNADVVPCFQYRVYKKFLSYNNQEFIEGMKFINTGNQTEVINYPKKHLANCKSKNIDTGGNFKSIVRIFKNIKRQLVENGHFDEKTAPSYFIENLLYNCSSPCFDGGYVDCMKKTLQFLLDALQAGRVSGFICANEQDSLISPKTWNLVNAQNFILTTGDYFLNPDNYAS